VHLLSKHFLTILFRDATIISAVLRSSKTTCHHGLLIIVGYGFVKIFSNKIFRPFSASPTLARFSLKSRVRTDFRFFRWTQNLNLRFRFEKKILRSKNFVSKNSLTGTTRGPGFDDRPGTCSSGHRQQSCADKVSFFNKLTCQRVN